MLNPARSDGRSMLPGCRITSMPLVSDVDPSASTPVKSGSWPKTMFAATPVRKPIITEWETKRVKRPSLRTPASTMRAPASITNMNNEAARSSGDNVASDEPAARAAAVVVDITISRVLDVRPPATGPAKLA